MQPILGEFEYLLTLHVIYTKEQPRWLMFPTLQQMKGSAFPSRYVSTVNPIRVNDGTCLQRQ